MGKQVKIKFNSKAFEEILCCSGTAALCDQKGEEIQARANANNKHGGAGFGVVSKTGKAYKSERHITVVHTTDHKSMVAEAEDKALSRAVY